MTDHTPTEPTGNPFIDPAAPTMADVLDRLGELDLSPNRLRDLRSAIRSLCRLIDRRPEEVPANVNWVHVRLRRVHPAKARISVKRFRNIKADALAALTACGCSRDRADWLRPPSPSWQSLLDRIPDRHDRWKLTQLAQYRSAIEAEPDTVTNAHLAELLETLERESFIDRPAHKVAQAALVWNRLHNSITGWPSHRLTAPRKNVPWTIPLDRFPDSFQEDVERWLHRLANPDPLEGRGPPKPLRPATINHRRFQIQNMASAVAGRSRISSPSLIWSNSRPSRPVFAIR